MVNSLLVLLNFTFGSFGILFKRKDEKTISHKRRYCSEQIENLSEDDKVTHNGG